MRITETQLRTVIKQELSKTLKEFKVEGEATLPPINSSLDYIPQVEQYFGEVYKYLRDKTNGNHGAPLEMFSYESDEELKAAAEKTNSPLLKTYPRGPYTKDGQIKRMLYSGSSTNQDSRRLVHVLYIDNNGNPINWRNKASRPSAQSEIRLYLDGKKGIYYNEKSLSKGQV
jgi:hypothetical protein